MSGDEGKTPKDIPNPKIVRCAASKRMWSMFDKFRNNRLKQPNAMASSSDNADVGRSISDVDPLAKGEKHQISEEWKNQCHEVSKEAFGLTKKLQLYKIQSSIELNELCPFLTSFKERGERPNQTC